MTATEEISATAAQKISIWRRVAQVAMLLAAALLVYSVLAHLVDDQKSANCDFIEYWASAWQLAHGANPYDIEAVYRLELAHGMPASGPLLSFSPPVALCATLPFGWMSAKNGLILWKMVAMGCILLTLNLLGRLPGRKNSPWNVLVFAFPPVWLCLMSGQIGIFFLLDVTLFLLFYRKRPWLAGASMLFCALKPHLFLPCFLVLAVDTVRRRDFRILAGLALALALSSGLTLLFDPLVWIQYRAMMRQTHTLEIFLPTLGSALRFGLRPDWKWLEFLPEVLACVWASWYYWTRRERWQWDREGLLVLLAGLVCTPYSFFTDQALLFPVILAGIDAARKSVAAWTLLALLALGCLPGAIVPYQLPSPFYLWTAPAWMIWYLFATRKRTLPTQSASAQP